MSEETTVFCQSCGATLGSYTERDGKVQLQVGILTIDWAHATCECGAEFHWRSSHRRLEHLVVRVLAIRQRVIEQV